MSAKPRLMTVGLCALLLTAHGCGPTTTSSTTITAWAAEAGRNVTPDARPDTTNDIYTAAGKRVSLIAALNETVAFQLAVGSSAGSAGPFELDVSDLAGPGDTLPASAFAVYRVGHTPVDRFPTWYRGRTGRPATPTRMPDALIPWDAPRGGGPLRIRSGHNEVLWIDVAVPPTLTPGTYRGTLALRRSSDETPAYQCTIELEVLPIALPGRRALSMTCRVDPRDLLAAHLRWSRVGAEQTRLLPDTPHHADAVRLVNATMRLLHEHRMTPVLWASFPKYRPLGGRKIEVDWEPYDRLISGWLDGSAFDDQVRLERWPVPVSLDYPSAARNGGVRSPQYARLLAAYLRECDRHFAEKGWSDRAFVRLIPPEPLSGHMIGQLEWLSGVVTQSEAKLPLVAHVPPSSMRGLGWHNAPDTRLPDVKVWAPPAMWYEPDAVRQAQAIGQQGWMMPSYPPYGGTLSIAAPPAETRVLPWLAYRYGADAVWVEHAADRGPAGDVLLGSVPWAGAPLVYPGEQYGLRGQPIPTVRLKRLRRGLQDYELLRLLEDNGQRLLAETLAKQIVRWACTDASLENLLTTRETGWPGDIAAFERAHVLMLRELASLQGAAPAEGSSVAGLAEWMLMLNPAKRVAADVEGVRLKSADEGMRAEVMVSVSNAGDRVLNGQWSLPTPPAGWTTDGAVPSQVPPTARRTAKLDVSMEGIAFNPNGTYAFDVSYDTTDMGAFVRRARLAVAACAALDTPPRVDGKLDDWPLASSNSAGDFRLCGVPSLADDKPTLPTTAFFGLDRDTLYMAVRCSLPPGEKPRWRADNVIPVDGAIPVNQDVVEILVDPRPATVGTTDDAYCLQVKPSGVLVEQRGCRTEPPMGESEPWQSGARVAVRVERDAWIVEIAIPIDAFGEDARRNNLWGMNVTRVDARRGEYSSWSGARRHCYLPQSLGNLIMLWQ